MISLYVLRHLFPWYNVEPSLFSIVKGKHEGLTFDHFELRALLQAFDGLELCKVIEHVAVELQGEAGAVARVLPVHQHLMDLLDHLLGRDLMEGGDIFYTFKKNAQLCKYSKT